MFRITSRDIFWAFVAATAVVAARFEEGLWQWSMCGIGGYVLGMFAIKVVYSTWAAMLRIGYPAAAGDRLIEAMELSPEFLTRTSETLPSTIEIQTDSGSTIFNDSLGNLVGLAIEMHKYDPMLYQEILEEVEFNTHPWLCSSCGSENPPGDECIKCGFEKTRKSLTDLDD